MAATRWWQRLMPLAASLCLMLSYDHPSSFQKKALRSILPFSLTTMARLPLRLTLS
nr:hypothetical protein [Mucilaginibacter mali]